MAGVQCTNWHSALRAKLKLECLTIRRLLSALNFPFYSYVNICHLTETRKPPGIFSAAISNPEYILSPFLYLH